MPTLREMVDGRTLETMKAASPAAKHVANHVQDPFGETQDAVEDLNQKRMDYEIAKQKMRTQLAPVQHVVDGIKNMHQLDGPGDGSPLDMSPNNPQNAEMNDPAAGQIDESTGVPNNMAQTPGQMNQNRPSQAGFSPGVAPGPQESVRPAKMGMPQPGQAQQGTVAGKPQPMAQPTGRPQPLGKQPVQGPMVTPVAKPAPKMAAPVASPNAPQTQPAAAPPKGNRSMPGAKGPGDPKVANRTKKAQNGAPGGRPVHVEVRADSLITNPVTSTVAKAAASNSLRFLKSNAAPCPKCGKVHAKGMKACMGSMKAGGPGSGRHPGYHGNPAAEGERAARRDNLVANLRHKGYTHESIHREIGMDRSEYAKSYMKNGEGWHDKGMKAGGPGSGPRPGGGQQPKQQQRDPDHYFVPGYKKAKPTQTPTKRDPDHYFVPGYKASKVRVKARMENLTQ